MSPPFAILAALVVGAVVTGAVVVWKVNTTTAGPINTTTAGPINTTTAGPINTTTAGPINTTTAGPINTTTAGPINTTTAGPINTTTAGPINNATPGTVDTSTAGKVICTERSYADPYRENSVTCTDGIVLTWPDGKQVVLFHHDDIYKYHGWATMNLGNHTSSYTKPRNGKPY